MNEYVLNVCMPVRDRRFLTEKSIDSLFLNSRIFKRENINIYLFDNKSDLDGDRSDFMFNLIKDKKIKYYSYDTDHTCLYCFGKVTVFQRWITMMSTENEFYHHSRIPINNTYYLLMDNDMLVGPGWDEYFISSMNYLTPTEPCLHYLLKYPGGVPEKYRKDKPIRSIRNEFKDETFGVQMGSYGGGSGFWFMNINMLKKLIWTTKELKYVYKINKKHDSTTWKLIYEKYKLAITNGSIISPDKNNPLVIHLGGRIGSICNKLTRDEYKGKIKEDLIKEEDLNIKDYTVDELWNKYKDTSNIW
jgi:hypothetical protein